MTLTATIKFLYAVSGFAAVLLYLPQVFKAWKDREHALSLSLVSFGGWCIGSLITALYAWLLLKDRIFTAVSMGNLAGSGAVFLIAANNRLEAGRDRGSTFGGYLHGTKRTTLRVSPRTVRMRRGPGFCHGKCKNFIVCENEHLMSNLLKTVRTCPKGVKTHAM